MYKVIAKLSFGIDDTFEAEYSGIEHATKEAAEAELTEAKLHEVDNESLIFLYIEED